MRIWRPHVHLKMRLKTRGQVEYMHDNKSYPLIPLPAPIFITQLKPSLPPWLMEPGSLQSVLWVIAISHLPSSDISFIFQLLKTQLSACIQISPSMLSHVSLFHDRRILKPKPTFFFSVLQKAEGLKAAGWWQEWMSESAEASPSC